MSEHDELESLVAGWVLGVLEAGEVEAVRAHIETCPICRDTALRLGRVVGALPLDLEDVTPPAALRERILAAAATSQGSTRALALPKTRTKQYRPATRSTKVSGQPRGLMSAYAAAAMVVLALLVGLVAGNLISRQVPAPAAVVRSALVGHQELASARASVIDLRSDGVALVDFSGLPQLDVGKVYELWLITSGGRVDPAGVFVPDSNGSKFVLVSKSLSGYNVMAVTREVAPAGTSAPTEQPQLYGNLA
jgi:anti-sigma-K factor RskA